MFYVLLAVPSIAGDVTQKQAMNIAKSFVQSNGSKIKSFSVAGRRLNLAYTAGSQDGKSCFYVFNIGNDGGFVIVSADDRANAILGYSDTGSFDYGRMSPHAKNWLAAYADQIQYIRKAGFAEKETATTYLDKEVKPLLGDIQWDQDSPYNDMCPSYDFSTRCATGCVATAMAQVMYYNRWPASGTGQHTYYPSILGGNPLTADFGNTSYDWDNMLPRYDANSNTASRNAVALLMLHCGIAVDMEYSTSSGATSQSVPVALATYFNYDKGIAYRTREYYSNTEWDEVIREEIDNGRPIVALGRSSAGGHAFVFDGYDRNGLIHVNWGWSGMSNGYFRTSALTPTMQGIGGSTSGYNYDQYIVTGIQAPDGNTDEDVEIVSTEGLVPSQGVITNGGTVDFRLCGFIANVGWKDSHFSYGLMITDAKGNLVRVIETGTDEELPVGYQILGPEFKGVSLGALDDGTYTLYPVCRVHDGKGGWSRIRDEYVGYPNYIYMTCSNDKITFSYPDYFDLKVTDVDVPTTIYPKVPAELKATITNNGDVDYLGDVYVSVVDRTTKRNITTGTAYKIDLKPGESINLSLVDAYDLEPGDYSITIVDDDNRRIMQYADITVAETPSGSTILEPAEQLSFTDNDNVNPENMEITAKVTCRNGVFGGMLYIYIFNETGTAQLGCLEPEYVFLNAGETAEVTFHGTFENGVSGTTYTACLMAYDGATIGFLNPMEMTVCQFRLGTPTSINSVEIDNNQPVKVYDISGKLLPYTNTDALPKGLYIVRQNGRTVKLVK